MTRGYFNTDPKPTTRKEARERINNVIKAKNESYTITRGPRSLRKWNDANGRRPENVLCNINSHLSGLNKERQQFQLSNAQAGQGRISKLYAKIGQGRFCRREKQTQTVPNWSYE
jgi:hypothetical protein